MIMVPKTLVPGVFAGTDYVDGRRTVTCYGGIVC